jgi:hypothetical protein
MTRAAALLLLLSGGCQSVPAFAIGEAAADGVMLAAEIGLPVYPSDDHEAEIIVVSVDDLAIGDRVVNGYAGARYTCRRFVLVNPDASPYTTAHEIGHVLGLNHTDDLRNLMHSSAENGALTDKQMRKTERVAGRLASCI